MLKKTIIFTLICTLSCSIFAKSALTYYQEGVQAQHKEDWFVATEFYLEALAINPDYGDAWFNLAECAYELDQYELALNYVTNASNYLKNRSDIENLKGFIYIGLGQLDDAKEVFTNNLVKYPNDIDARFGLAQLELFKGKFFGAEDYFLDALQRDSANKKALISLALIADEMGETQKAKNYINQALRYHRDRADVYFFAGYLSAKTNDSLNAEKYLNTALSINPQYVEANKLLADVYYTSGRYSEAIEVCDILIELDNENATAWYIKGFANAMLGNNELAISNWSTGLKYDPQDEIMRAAFELYINQTVLLEDSRRTAWSKYHLEKAQIASEKYFSDVAEYEYVRTLRLEPLNIDARIALAEIYLQDGYPLAYLQQLQFLQNQGLTTVSIDDSIESYESMLSNTLSTQWDIDTFYLDKTRYTIDLYHFEEELSLFHQDILSITTGMLEEVINSSSFVKAIACDKPVSSYAEAYRLSRQEGNDLFAMIDVTEGERDIQIVVDIYSSRTGVRVASWEVYRTGNDRYSSALQKVYKNLSEVLPQKGQIIDRRGSSILIDLGKKEGVEIGDVFEIYKQNTVDISDNELSLKYDTKNLLGTITITAVCEEIAQGSFKKNGFYDLVNIGDEVVPSFVETEETPVDETEETENKETEISPDVQQVQIERESSVLYDLIDSIQ